jgi:hypothetical protein
MSDCTDDCFDSTDRDQCSGDSLPNVSVRDVYDYERYCRKHNFRYVQPPLLPTNAYQCI